MRVLLDACVLYPTVLREILVGVAGRGVFRPVWSERILEEWCRAAARLGSEGEGIARTERAALEDTWPAAAVTPRHGDLARLHLPDPNDVHVLAAAIAGHADILCTFNARDFPRRALAIEGVERLGPDQLLSRMIGDQGAAIRCAAHEVHATAERLAGEPLPLRGLLKRARLPRLGKALAE